MTLGSFFDGIGGWLLAAKHAGVNPMWASEIDDFPAAVTAHHFPNVRQMGDITKIDVDKLEPVDIICAGSPCQDLSVAGKREGLSGERSGLFRTAIKLVHGLRTRTGKPRYFVWENVPGAFSSNKGHDFAAVLSEITKTEIPMPKDGRWAESGCVEWGGTSSLAWRTLDAQYWGVPQRRKRIFLVADFDGRSAGEILFVEQGVPRDSAESARTGEEIAGRTGKSVDSASYGIDHVITTGGNCTAQGKCYYEERCPTMKAGGVHAVFDARHIDSASGTLTPWDVQSNRIQSVNGKAAALYGGAGQGTHNGAIFDTRQIVMSVHENQQGEVWETNKFSALSTGGGKPGQGYPCVACYDISHRQDVIRPQENGTLPCLTARAGTGGNNLPIVHCLNDQGGKVMDVSEEKTGTLRAEAHGHAPIVHTIAIEGNGSRPSHKGDGYKETDKMYTLNTTEVHGVAMTNKSVRRLTPLEAERLQGLPDGYTDIEFNGKPAPDSRRYKAIGNGMAQPVADFVIKRIVEVANSKGKTI